jgi:purine-binding chemotaxis protein CheW
MYERSHGRQFLALTFALRDRLYALEQRGAATLLPWLQRYAPPSATPGLPEWCLGLLNVRGTVQMLADLGALLGLGPSEIGENSRLIFIEHGTAQLGLLVDREIGVRTLGLSESPADELSRPFVSCHASLEGRSVLVLDGASVIRHVAEELRAPPHLG